MRYAWIDAQRLYHAVETLCRVLMVSRAGYYAWRRRPKSQRAVLNEELLKRIHAQFLERKRRYGSPRIRDDLREEGLQVGKHRVARLMRNAGLYAKAARRFRITTDSSHTKEVAPDLLERNFRVEAPDRVYVGDMTYLWTEQGWLYLAVWIDLYSRLVVGWALGKRLDAALVCSAFERACARRRPQPGFLVHSDRGTQYASAQFRRLLKQQQARQSMSLKGDCWGNAVAESFFHSFKVEAIFGERFSTRREMELEVFDYIERFYNKVRRHSALGSRSPLVFEIENNRKAAA